MFILLRLVLDILFINFSYITAYLIRFQQLSPEGFLKFPLPVYGKYLAAITLIYLICFQLWGMYKTRKGFLIEIDALVEGFIAILMAWVLIIVMTFIKGEYVYSRPIIILSLPIALFNILIYRQVLLRIEVLARAKGFNAKRAIVVGSGDLASSVAARIKAHPSYGIFFAGYIGMKGSESLGGLEDIEKVIDEHKIASVYIADMKIPREKLAELADICDKRNVSLGTLPDVFQILTTSPVVQDIEGMPMVSLKAVQLTPFNQLIKRTFDVVLSLFGLAVFGLPMVLIAAVIRISSHGPAIYVQKRIGKDGRPFRLYKFRTMIHKAEKGIGPVLATEDDPRKTPIGRLLRSTNLDELPQLFNILKGDMSFVGPRPERPKFVSRFREAVPNYMERHRINVGLAGWAQMQEGGYEMTADEKLKYDLFYIENWSPILDIKILLKCIEIAFTRKRAN